ncbi:interferon-induced GTP-binding protein Mx1 [Nannizzia gypsea CBS 118893]|uniref:Interferon-induced GTP-binding protein Mx1 n=1 Tax=Arthroderma gypseum (strain ATCC MYA-4604 / CBS 118893) TaxID=535722 RepID=E4V5D3_ARTGP|nr:interferon-induced GTP-binding protein Mx1 [Nannizzia gypsea CBS 118893]EFR05207.1 interferon-induced GTP-binding protein Mx1 [Nannizzia gypsea CBS 118893]
MTVENTDYQKLGDPALLSKIDALLACGVGEYVDLPQIVVVGDQSSGKSSVLEGLTKLPFPRNSGLCTRFATLITFRRSEAKRISVSIRPHVNSDKEHAAKVRAWKSEWETLSARSFGQIMEEVYEVMGLSGPEGKSGGKTFSNDVLQLEISGPEEDHLSVIDVPGIFKNTTEGITTKSDIEMVREMVYSYMRNPRSIMLIVVPANVDIATQEIVEMARELDPEGERTLGVLTKPDLVDRGAESDIVDLISGKRPGNRVQWSVVRNPGQKDLCDQNTDRQAEMRLFRDVSPWNTLDQDRVGISALRKRLQEVITSRTRHEFPKVKAEISKRLQASRRMLQALGAERDTPEKQRAFLVDLATQYERVTSHAMSANYGADDLFDKHKELRIATKVTQRNEVFSEDMESWGHERPTDMSNDGNDLDAPEDTITIRETADLDDLEDILQPQECVLPPSPGITHWLRTLYKDYRGFELGTFASTLLAALMKEQSKKWDLLALGYISDIMVMTHSYVLCLLEAICIDERIKSGLMSVLMDGLLERHSKARDQVVFLLSIERAGLPATLNEGFSLDLQTRRQERLNSAEEQKLMQKVILVPTTYTNGMPVRSPEPMSRKNNSDHVIHELNDILSSYYSVARKRFVDNVLLQAAHYMLVTGPDTPLRLLSPSYILSLSEEQLENIAGEDPSTARKRGSLRKEIEGLEKGRRILL